MNICIRSFVNVYPKLCEPFHLRYSLVANPHCPLSRPQPASAGRARMPGAARSPDLRAPGGLRPLLQVHQRHADPGTVRERSAVRRQGQRPQPLQLPLGCGVRQQEGCLWVGVVWWGGRNEWWPLRGKRELGDVTSSYILAYFFHLTKGFGIIFVFIFTVTSSL